MKTVTKGHSKNQHAIDRFQATIRHPDYRRDAQQYIPILRGGLLNFAGEIATGLIDSKRWHDVVSAYTFLRIWGLEHPIDPEDPQQVMKELAALTQGNTSLFLNDLRVFSASTYEKTIDPRSGYYIGLYVDLERPTDELIKLFTEHITQIRSDKGIKTKKKKQHRVDPWTVWDMNQVLGNNLLQITHKLFDVEGEPAYDEATRNAYMQVKRAFEKAQSLIKRVGASRNNAITREAVEASLIHGLRLIFEQFRKLSTV